MKTLKTFRDHFHRQPYQWGSVFFTAERVATFSSFYFLSFLEYKHLFPHFLFL